MTLNFADQEFTANFWDTSGCKNFDDIFEVWNNDNGRVIESSTSGEILAKQPATTLHLSIHKSPYVSSD